MVVVLVAAIVGLLLMSNAGGDELVSLLEGMYHDDEMSPVTKSIKAGNEQVLARLLKVKPESSEVVTSVQPAKSAAQVRALY